MTQRTLEILAHFDFLRMVMEAIYYAFRRWLDTPIIIWEYDRMPGGLGEVKTLSIEISATQKS